MLNHNDYIELTCNDKPFKIHFDDYTNLNAEVFAELLSNQLEKTGISVEVDQCNRFVFTCAHRFVFNSMSYNVKLLLGLYSKKDDDIRAGNICGEYVGENGYLLKINSVGFFLSTPILNLVSNIGESAYQNSTNDIMNLQSCPTVLRVNNSFSPSVPIISTGDGSSSVVPSGYISGSVFVLVDANNHQVDLLSPLYITLLLEPLSDRYET